MNEFVIETKQLTEVYCDQTAVSSVNLHVKEVKFMDSFELKRIME